MEPNHAEPTGGILVVEDDAVTRSSICEHLATADTTFGPPRALCWLYVYGPGSARELGQLPRCARLARVQDGGARRAELHAFQSFRCHVGHTLRGIPGPPRPR